MVAQNFQPSLALVLKAEGGDVDDPEDHGGRTSRGITQRTYDAYRRGEHQPLRDVFHASAEEVADIYHEMYWNPICDWLPVGVDYIHFDFEVNAGPHEAMKVLQQAVRTRADGVWGPQTREAVGAYPPATIISAYSQLKRIFYRGLHQPRFLTGWLNRSSAVQAAALHMAEEVKHA